jgi:hypothetical protein
MRLEDALYNTNGLAGSCHSVYSSIYEVIGGPRSIPRTCWWIQPRWKAEVAAPNQRRIGHTSNLPFYHTA